MKPEKSQSETPIDPRASAPPSILQMLRSSILAGLLVVAPFTITIWLAWTLIQTIDDLVLPFIPEDYLPDNPLPIHVPGFGLFVFLVFLIIVGWLARNFFGREIIRIGEGWVTRMPVMRSIYNGLKQILETIFMQSSNSFEHACLIEYPRREIWSIGFVSTTTRGEIARRAAGDEEMMSVFLPTTPNPTSGFLLFLPRKDVIILDMTIEEAAKLVISAGLIMPPEQAAVAAGAEGHTMGEEAEETSAQGRRARRRGRGRNDTEISPGRAGESAARHPFPPFRR